MTDPDEGASPAVYLSIQTQAARRRRTRCLSLAAWLVLSMVPMLPLLSETIPEEGGSVTVALEPGEARMWTAELEADDLLVVEVEQTGLDAELEIRSPDGASLRSADRQRWIWGSERVWFLADESMEVEVVVHHRGSRPGEAILGVESWRSARGDDGVADRDRYAAELLFESAWHPTVAVMATEEYLERAHAAAAAFRVLGLPERESAAWTAASVILQFLGRNEESVAAAERGIELAREAGELGLETDARMKRATAIWAYGGPDAAIEEELRVIELAGDGRVPPKELQARRVLVLDLQDTGRYLEAIEHHEMAVELADAIDSPKEKASSLLNIGGVHRKRGDFRAALKVWSEGRDLFRSVGDERFAALCSDNIASVQADLHDFEGALANHRAALEVIEREGEPREISLSYANIGGVLEALGRPAEARQAYRMAREFGDASGELSFVAGAELRLGELDLDDGDVASGCARLEEARVLTQQAGVLSEMPAAMVGVGRCRATQGEDRRAKALFREARDLAVQLDMPRSEIAARLSLVEALRRSKDQQEALDEVWAAIARAEATRRRVPLGRLQVTYSARVRELYDLALQLELELSGGRRDEAAVGRWFDLAESARGRALFDLLHSVRADARAGLDRELVEREEVLLSELEVLSAELVAVRGTKTPEDDEIERLRGRIAEVEIALDAVADAYRRSAPRQGVLLGGAVGSRDEIRRGLAADSALLLYHVLSDRTLLFALSPGGLELFELPPVSEIEAALEGLRTALRRPSRFAGRFVAAASLLGETLLGPALRSLEGVDRLVLSPDGPLHTIPFEALLIGGDAASDAWSTMPFVVRRYETAYVSSGGVLAALSRDLPTRGPAAASTPVLAAFADPTGDGVALAVDGDEVSRSSAVAALERHLARTGRSAFAPLPHARDEVRSIAETVGAEKSVVWLGAEATEERARGAAARQARYLHFGTHGYVDHEIATQSALVLGASEQADGLLQAAEILRTRFAAELVTLSACETAVGRARAGEGPQSLATAFLYAGAESLVGSLWPVSDRATAGLMTELYRSLEAGQPRATALRRARLAVLGASRTAHPHYWAPFLLFGQPE